MKKIAILAIIILAVGGGIVAYASESKGLSKDNSINNTIQSSDSNTNNNNGQSYNQGNGENKTTNTEDKTTNTEESSNNVINKNTTNHLSTSKYKNMFLMFTQTICTPISLEPAPGVKSANAWQFNPYTTGKLISQGDKWDKVMIENKI